MECPVGRRELRQREVLSLGARRQAVQRDITGLKKDEDGLELVTHNCPGKGGGVLWVLELEIRKRKKKLSEGLEQRCRKRFLFARNLSLVQVLVGGFLEADAPTP